MNNTLVFYANQLYGEYAWSSILLFNELRNLPEGAYIRSPHSKYEDNVPTWYRSDFTPVLDSDIPKELLVLVLLLT